MHEKVNMFNMTEPCTSKWLNSEFHGMCIYYNKKERRQKNALGFRRPRFLNSKNWAFKSRCKKSTS